MKRVGGPVRLTERGETVVAWATVIGLVAVLCLMGGIELGEGMVTGFTWIAVAVAATVAALVILAVWLLWPAFQDGWDLEVDLGDQDDDYDRLTGAPW